VQVKQVINVKGFRFFWSLQGGTSHSLVFGAIVTQPFNKNCTIYFRSCA
jgi:hypothetical protein